MFLKNQRYTILNFRFINSFAGFILFITTFIVYLLTLEPTASFWDCAEFIACSNKLEIPHPPGAPLFLLIGRLFSLLAGTDVTKIAYWINTVSALASAATIAFLYWTISLMARKIVPVSGTKPTIESIILIVGSGVIGALAFAFSDSFWFSAVEGEVYALSSLFIAVVFWTILKWESVADQPGSDKYLLLIAYTVGLSIGVHLLCLLAIPAISLVYFYKRYPYSHKGFFLALVTGFGILEVIQLGIIEGLPTIAGKTEVFFVNSLHLPFGSGIAIFSIVFFSVLVAGIWYSVTKKKVLLNTILLCLVFLLIGFSSYIIILVRSAYNPNIDQNNPENVLNFLKYIKREQYEQRPVFYGPNYTAELIDQVETEPVYQKGKNNYEIIGHKIKNVFDPKHCTVFPRMASKQSGHSELYARWLNKPAGKKPTLMDNIRFFITYQLGHMYWRYLLWNFAGREGDIQDSGWLRPWDNFGDIPVSIIENKYRNNYFMLPLILGLLGMIFLYQKKKRLFIVTATLFLFTGVVLVVYQNSPPVEPRERDYIYVGSFYVFSIWIGLGLAAVAETLKKMVGNPNAVIASFTLCLAVPALMAKAGWNDHDRSMRVHSAEFARNILNSCEKDAILFTGGDNDTFMLWYIQEVEGFRTDVRVCNLSLLNMEYYIDGMKRPSYLSAPLPISFEQNQYRDGRNDYLPYMENPSGRNGILLPVYLDLVRKQDHAITVQAYNGSSIAVLPSSTLLLPVDTAEVKKYFHKDYRFDTLLKWDIGKKALDKSQLMVLDIITNNRWRRPVYFFMALSDENYMGLKDHMQMEGYTYRLFPFRTTENKEVPIDTETMYNNVSTKMSWTNLNHKNLNVDENYKRTLYYSRMLFLRLAIALYEEGKSEKALEIINKSLNTIPDTAIPFDFTTPQLVALLLELKQTSQALTIAKKLADDTYKEIQYYEKYDTSGKEQVQTGLYILYNLVTILKEKGYTHEIAFYENFLSKYMGTK